jgi:parallel beta helix pectate lyase-like protein
MEDLNMTASHRARAAAGLFALVLVVAACGGSDGDSSADTSGAESGPVTTEAVTTDPQSNEPESTDAPTTQAPDETSPTSEPDAAGVLRVPDDFATITEAVEAAVPGDLVLISPGTYHEAVNVTTDDVTIRGLDRNEVILDGEFELDNGIRILGASGVVVENLTAQNYTSNGVFALETDGYRVSYVNAIRNGDYGIYGFDSINGTIEHSYAAGSPDAGVYIGQCFPCDSLIDDFISEHNGLGYSGTNSGGNLYIVNSTFRNNRAGVVPNSGSYELCYPERQTTLVGNIVHSNNQPDTPAIDVALLAMGNGILIPGGVGNVVERNLVFDHEKTGIGLTPFLEEGPNDDLPSEDEWTVDCATQREQELAAEVPESLLWEAYDNSIRDNVVEASGVADLGVAGVSVPSADLRNCWSGNVFTTSAPNNIEVLAPCGATGSGNWEDNPLDVLSWIAEADSRPPSVDYKTAELPPPPVLEGMADPENAPVEPAKTPRTVDLAAIVVPTKPAS